MPITARSPRSATDCSPWPEVPHGFVIRFASASDAAAVAAIHATSWRSAYRGIYPDAYLDDEAPAERSAHWSAFMACHDPERDAVLIAEEGDEAVGFACLLRNGDVPLLDNLHVLPDRKGEGIGRRLLAAAAAWLAEREPDAPLELGVWEGNRAARRFYASLGGTETGTSAIPVPGGGSAPQVRVRWERAAALASLQPLRGAAPRGAKSTRPTSRNRPPSSRPSTSS
jgi:GNAT superfamily N-acetyltransferase